MANAANTSPEKYSVKNLESTSDPDFSNGILALDGDRKPVGAPDVDFAGPGRPRSSGTITSVTSNTSTGSRGNGVCTEYLARGFFSRKSGYFDKAITEVRTIINNDVDGDIRGAWLLTEIDHWDNEKEKVIVLTQKSIFVVKYDFVAEKILGHKRVMLCSIDKTQRGHFYYPENSVMPPRKNGGIRISWAHGEPIPNGKKWNPWSSDIPFLTLASHPLSANESDQDTTSYNVDDFYETFLQELKIAHKKQASATPLQMVDEDILIESYASVSSMIFNQSFLGFSRERGGVSF